MKLLKKLIKIIVASAAVFAALEGIYVLYPLKYEAEMVKYSAEMGVDVYLTAALIKAESNFDANAISSSDAKGLMQLTDETALFCAQKTGHDTESSIYDPETNIRLGVYYLKRMLTLFENDENVAVAAYNAGEGRVREWLADENYSSDGKTLEAIPYEETRKHVEKIQKYKKIYKLLYPQLGK